MWTEVQIERPIRTGKVFSLSAIQWDDGAVLYRSGVGPEHGVQFTYEHDRVVVVIPANFSIGGPKASPAGQLDLALTAAFNFRSLKNGDDLAAEQRAVIRDRLADVLPRWQFLSAWYEGGLQAVKIR